MLVEELVEKLKEMPQTAVVVLEGALESDIPGTVMQVRYDRGEVILAVEIADPALWELS